LNIVDIFSENYSSYQRANPYHSMLQVHCICVGIQSTTATAVIVTNGTAGRNAYAYIR